MPGAPADTAASRPHSRFQEGSMNDRISTAPPPQFLGPEQLAIYEQQFYADSSVEISSVGAGRAGRKPRPMSASAQLQSGADLSSADSEQPQPPKRPVSFLGRVRDVFSFGRSARTAAAAKDGESITTNGSSASLAAAAPPRENSAPKRTSFQASRLGVSQSQTHLAQAPRASFAGTGAATTKLGSDARPSREEILASYNQLMASGFFQSHAIQSTRQPPTHLERRSAPQNIPGASSSARPSMECSRRPSLATIHASPSHPSSLAAEDAPWPAPTMAAPFVPSGPSTVVGGDAQRYPLRGRKRTRTDSDDALSGPSTTARQTNDQDAQQQQHQQHQQQVTGTRRMVKKLRKMASSTSNHASDGVLSASAHSVSTDTRWSAAQGRPVRYRSPSPAPRSSGPRRSAPVLEGISDRSGENSTSNSSSRSSSAQNKLRKRRSARTIRGGASGPRASAEIQIWEQPGPDRMSIDSRGSLDGAALREALQTSGPQPHKAPLSVLPDAQRGVPGVPRIPTQYKRSGGVYDENVMMNAAATATGEWRIGEAM